VKNATQPAGEQESAALAEIPARMAPPRRKVSRAGTRAAHASLSVVVFFVIFASYSLWLGRRFLDAPARLLDIHQNTPIVLLGLAAMITLVAGMFDLSIASVATLTTFLSIGLRTKDGLSFPLVVVLCLLIGAFIGLINGLLVEYLRINAFIATLSTGGIALGVSSVYSGGAAVVPGSVGPALPIWFGDLGSFTAKMPAWIPALALVAAVLAVLWLRLQFAARTSAGNAVSRRQLAGSSVIVAGVIAAVAVALAVVGSLEWFVFQGESWLIGLLLGVAVLLWLTLDFSVFGRELKATGANPIAARLAGVKTSRVVIRAFVSGGVLAALAGVTLAASQGSATPDIAGTYLLPAFAAAFLSTVVFSTGRFTVWGTVLGGIFVVWVGQGLIVGGLPSTWTEIVNGAVLAVAVAVSTIVRRRGV
jgi:ribose/xylose/arabinose/galactoside ABC-type transport system permease subunit